MGRQWAISETTPGWSNSALPDHGVRATAGYQVSRVYLRVMMPDRLTGLSLQKSKRMNMTPTGAIWNPMGILH